MQAKLVVKNLYKVFGDQPQEAMSLVAQGLSKEEIFARTGHTVGVNDASFEVHEGEIFVIMGLSGSGKSTLVRMLNRLIEPTSGQVLFGATDIARMSDRELRDFRRKHISMVFQSFALMPHLTVLENAAFGLMLSGEDKSVRSQRALAALEQVGLAQWAESYPDELSGGMQQRVGLARALANDPDILLMDEAFSALDPLIRTEMQDELVKLQAAHKRTIVFISHDLDEAIRIGNRIAIMQGGDVVQVGTAEEILRNPANDYVRSFFRGVDATSILSAADIARRTQVSLIDHAGMGVRSALERLRANDREYGYVLTPDQRLLGVVSIESLRQALRRSDDAKLVEAFLPDVQTIAHDRPIAELYEPLTRTPFGMGLPVIDERGRYRGSVTRNTMLEFLHRQTTQEAA
ncbi:MAG: glycine betaine/L-proline ABC transporter ATP-binding protein [Candidatus Dactylopiibacterium carminicum]|uniref:Quaternary amine transport ATP-binding protein n=1 Tax=Candidatus Dactylopiibacterium carminicum TaxID=857335 RepID=A0A272ERW6_9RHOO|nr:glycine betaine/L-proline ABC transporter ATP-binding protein ProV [Candidatus Dactylopiibacterium carminicum]KAF7598963.1 proline/glycine betaine ABC transporter ATP-binding protein ProV [Candidatus Dactylopiibacterium carminicum]PAS92851.1 MAG: glycine betaine/L-proline ABC transporter ATP-binding protein [Candidatus Dactylopiibacterium carminicum]PAS96355.1 MAG: glycine betaine/L-proline ABC transporter ATP-binding protein [Candidatus Dactylopiibacterium carminicum]PAS98976.1 MAG: glycine